MTKLLLIGEAWGEEEEYQRAPFVGASGYILTKMLEEAGLHRADIYLTNVFNLRPPANKIEALCGPRQEGITGMPYLIKGKYVRREFAPELIRLGDEILEHNPNLIVACGNTPLWALTGGTGIGKVRGSVTYSTITVSGVKVLPTYHPAAVARQWDLRPTTVADLMKAKREQEFPDIRRPMREVWIEPSLEDLYEFRRLHITGCRCLAVDIETAGQQITCVGFAPNPSISLVVPFVDHRRKGRSYWPTKEAEKLAWVFVRSVLEDRMVRKVFQNGMYDIAFLWRANGVRVYGAEEDTMLLHHALHPESLKGLGFLGSIYTDEGAWKAIHKANTTIKRDQ